MKKSKIAICIVAALLAIILPFLSVVVTVMATPPQYSASFTGALNEKYDRLHSIEGEKIIVVGGSSVAFGLDSADLERYTGMPVVNFGLYAALGTKVMLDLSDSAISKGDIVILSPELDPQTLSMYFNSRTTLEAIDDDYSMMLDIGFDNWFNLFGGMWSFAGDKLERMNRDYESKPDPIYNSANVNEYGDFSGPRPENVMPRWYDSNTPIDLSVGMLGDGFDEFCDYLNKYIAKAKLKGARVYFSYCPMNEMALTDNSAADKDAFTAYLEEKINCKFISDIDDYIMEAGYFFDTNFHLNDAGVDVRTARLALDIRMAADIVGGIIDAEPSAPDLPGKDIIYTGALDPNAKYFTYSVIAEGAFKGAYSVTGLTPLGREQSELTLPVGADGLRVVTVSEGAFSGGSVERLNIPRESYLSQFANGSFLDSDVKEIYFYTPNMLAIIPPADFVGADPALRVHVIQGTDVSGSYEWSQRGLDFVYDIPAE